MANRKALLIGINDYDFLGELKYARQDAHAVSLALQQYCGFDGDEITIMCCDAAKNKKGLARYIEHAISSLRNHRELEMLVFGFWGHGFSPSPEQRYLCGIDTDEADLERTAVSFNFVCSQLAQVQAENTIILLDCCQNKPAGRGTAETMTEGEEAALASIARDIQAAQKQTQKYTIPTVALLNACSEGQKAYEWPDKQHGVFTAHLLEAFSQGFGSVAPMAAYTTRRVLKTTKELYNKEQIPYIKIEGGGDIFLPKPVAASAPKPIPKITIDDAEAKRGIYRDALIRVAADGQISRDEWLEISALRGELGLNTSVYNDIEKQLWGGTTLDEICAGYVSIPKIIPATPASPPRAKSSLLEDVSLDCGKGVQMKLKLIPAGSFIMGSNESGDEKPPHKVEITEPFYMCVYPVTQAQYKALMGKNPSNFKGDDNPVEQVSWNHANDFCEELSCITGKTIKLPTEAQWEYACRAGTTTKYSFGDSESRLDLYGWFDGNSGNKTHPVGQKKPNPWGLYDMHGNVREWCYDWYNDNFYAKSDKQDPVNLQSSDARVVRGGSWGSNPWLCRSALRNWLTPGNAGAGYGFRVVWLL